MTNLFRLIAMLSLSLSSLFTRTAQATVFDLPGFIEAGKFTVGFEPEVTISNGTGAALNFKPRFGMSDFLNIEGMVGTGAGARKFRAGVTADFDWFPDIDKQPGIATPFFIEYYRVDQDGVLTMGAKPMIYKTFQGEHAAYTPFLAFPIGWNYRNSDTQGMMQISMGSMFRLPGVDHWRYTAEAGFNINHSYSYLSGGVTYFF